VVASVTLIDVFPTLRVIGNYREICDSLSAVIEEHDAGASRLFVYLQ
jgi:hypothetical protein